MACSSSPPPSSLLLNLWTSDIQLQTLEVIVYALLWEDARKQPRLKSVAPVPPYDGWPVPIHHTADGPSPRLCTEHLKVWATMKPHWQNHYKPSYSFKLAFKWTPEKIWRNWYGTMSCFWKVVVLFPIWSDSLWKGSSVYPHWVAQSCVSVSESPVFFIRHLTFQGLRIKICLPGGVQEKDCMKNRRKENQRVQLLSHMQGTFATADQINLNKYFHHYSIGGSSGILQNALSFDNLDY